MAYNEEDYKTIGISPNKVVFRTLKIANDNHYLTHSDYLKKDDSIIIQEISNKEKTKIINEGRKRARDRAGKRGRPPKDFISMIISIPDELAGVVKRMSKSDVKKLSDEFMDTMIRDLTRKFPDADIKQLKDRMEIVLHKDTKNPHFHILTPHFANSKSIFNKGPLVQIDFTKRDVSSNMRRKMFNKFKAMKFRKDLPDLDEREFTRISKEKSQKITNKKGNKLNKETNRVNRSYSKQLAELIEIRDEISKQFTEWQKTADEKAKLKAQKQLERLNNQIHNKNDKRGLKTAQNLQMVMEIKPDDKDK